MLTLLKEQAEDAVKHTHTVCMELVLSMGSLVLHNEGFQFTSWGGFFMSGWS